MVKKQIVREWLAIWKFIIRIFEKLWCWTTDIGHGIHAVVVYVKRYVRGEGRIRARNYWYRRLAVFSVVWMVYLGLGSAYQQWIAVPLTYVWWYVVYRIATLPDHYMRAYAQLHNSRPDTYVKYNPDGVELLAGYTKPVVFFTRLMNRYRPDGPRAVVTISEIAVVTTTENTVEVSNNEG